MLTKPAPPSAAESNGRVYGIWMMIDAFAISARKKRPMLPSPASQSTPLFTVLFTPENASAACSTMNRIARRIAIVAYFNSIDTRRSRRISGSSISA